jgi:NADPH-dependent 2,4-dienoyl-CoA reductase/sulfur reductase-like enzyme/bacterioferritin-associated ferredoxin
MKQSIQPVVVGAGPAGVRAAQTLVQHGLRPTVIDEGALWGGQIYRQPPHNFLRSKAELYGFESSRADALHRAMAGILNQVDYRPQTLVWNAQDQVLDTMREGQSGTAPYTHLIIATGATDRVLPFPGWTLPGVFTLGGAQVALKFQGCSIGRQVVFMGTGPLLYLVAYQYARAGANVAAVLDTAQLSDQVKATPALFANPVLLAKGVYYLAWLRLHGVHIAHGIEPLQALGEKRVSGFAWRDANGDHALACDAIGFGYALRSETQLADILGCRFDFDTNQRAYLPVRDRTGRSSVAGVYLAGDGAGIMGADAAELAGTGAALAVLSDIQGAEFSVVDQHHANNIEKKIERTKVFRLGLERAFPFPQHWASSAPDDLMICRCEEITAGDIRQAAQGSGATELNRVKALTRLGMGRCQSRMCGAAAAEILAHCLGDDIESVGRLRGQAPIKPIPFVSAPVQSEYIPGGNA